MVLIGTDVSRFDDKRGQHKVIAIVIGADDTINTIHNNLGRKNLHMVNLSPAKRNKIKKILTFESDRILGLSITVGKNRIVKEIHEEHKTKEQFASKGAIHSYFDHLLLPKIRNDMESFLSKFGVNLSDVIFECDSDMKDTISNWKLQHSDKGKAHQLADVLAYFCKLGTPPPGCVKMDLEHELESQMKAELIR